ALAYFHERFGIARAVLPRVLSLTQVQRLCERSPVPIEVFAFGSLCIMVEGRCRLSSYVTGASPNRHGVCSPARFVRWDEHEDGSRSVRLNGVLVDRYGAAEAAGYPTVCKGRFAVGGAVFHALEEPTSLNTLALLPQLRAAGVAALKIEGRQRGAAYVGAVTRVWRGALDALAADPEGWRVVADWQARLARHAEGHQTTFGAYHRSWHLGPRCSSHWDPCSTSGRASARWRSTGRPPTGRWTPSTWARRCAASAASSAPATGWRWPGRCARPASRSYCRRWR